MLIQRGFRAVPSARRGAVVALGNFDGVHRGHQALIARARAVAQTTNAAVGIVTFRPHPREVLFPETAPLRLGTFRLRAEALAALGVERVYVLPFNATLRGMSPKAFIEDVLVEGLGIGHAIVGHGFRFGHKRAGDPEVLKAAGSALGFGVDILEQVAADGDAVSSTRVRNALEAGDFALATDLLDRPYQIDATVVRGDQIGRTIGFPTANLKPLGRRILMPRGGVWAARLRLPDGSWADGAANLGWRPVFDGKDLRLEVHLMDRTIDLYGARVRLACHLHLRDEANFDDVEALKVQMHKDCDRATAYLANVPATPSSYLPRLDR